MNRNYNNGRRTESGYFEIVDSAKIFKTKSRYIEIRLVKDKYGRYYTRLYSKVKKEKGYFEEEKVDLGRFPISPGMVFKISNFFRRVMSEYGLFPHPTIKGRWIEPEEYYRIQDKYTTVPMKILLPKGEFDLSDDE